MKLLTWLVVLALAASGVRAQDPPAKSPQPYIRTSAEAVVSAKPDRAKINIGVTTQAPAAQAAAAQNAKELDAIIRQIRSTLGSAVELKTIGYSVNQDFRYKQGAPPTIAGYTATNILEVTLNDITQAGKLIDAAIGDGELYARLDAATDGGAMWVLVGAAGELGDKAESIEAELRAGKAEPPPALRMPGCMQDAGRTRGGGAGA